MSIEGAISLLVVGWLPGALVFRAPFADRDRRASLPAEERVFWAVIISLTLSLAIATILASAGQYSFRRLLAIDIGIAGIVAAASRFRLRLGPLAPAPRLAALVPVALVVFGLWRFPPPAEYVMGGKDPGVYMNEGIQIAQRGSLVIADDVIASVPAPMRDLFFPSHQNPYYYSLRFMGFFIQDPDRGHVVGQFPHLYPMSIALGYGVDGLTGARRTSVFWATLGLVSVYFAGTRIAGRSAAAAAATLLGLHVLQLWYARYPNSEVMMQALLFAALAAADRAIVDRSAFFGTIAGLILGLQLTLRFDVVLAYAAVAGAVALGILHGRRLPWPLIGSAAITAGAGFVYLVTLMTGYSYYPLEFTRRAVLVPLIGASLAVLAGLFWSTRTSLRTERVRRLVPFSIVGICLAAAAYAWFFRAVSGRTAIHDAMALRTFTYLYLTVPALIAALAGFAWTMARRFWTAPSLLLTITAFSVFFFYKIRIVPEHFWMGRRFLPVILPGALLFVCAIALLGLEGRLRGRRVITAALGAVFVILLGSTYARTAGPIVPHVEYAGIIPKLEALAGQIGDDDLLVVESRDASDIHVLALPLAYIYARHVILLNTPVPDKAVFGSFLDWAWTKYRRILFLGGGGTDLLSRQWSVRPVLSERFSVPEYATTPWNLFPRGVEQKEFDYGLYEFAGPEAAQPYFDLDVGVRDDLHVVRFHAKEQSEGTWMRWTSRNSYVAVSPISPESKVVTIWMSNGGRPAPAGPAEVTVYLQGHLLGTAAVGNGFQPYEFAIPPSVAASAAAADPARLRLVSTLWNPHDVLGTGDDRDLGVMVDRVRVR